MATLEQAGQAAADTVPNLHPSGVNSDASFSRCFAADFFLLVFLKKTPTVSGFSYRVELVENFHQVLLQLHPDLFALPRQEGNVHEAVSLASTAARKVVICKCLQ